MKTKPEYKRLTIHFFKQSSNIFLFSVSTLSLLINGTNPINKHDMPDCSLTVQLQYMEICKGSIFAFYICHFGDHGMFDQ